MRVDLMSRMGSHTLNLTPGEQFYDVPIAKGAGGGGAVHLRCKIRDRDASDGAKTERGLASQQRKLQTALMMRSYLDNHDVLRQMEELLQEMVSNRPEDPIDYMIGRLEEVCLDTQ